MKENLSNDRPACLLTQAFIDKFCPNFAPGARVVHRRFTGEVDPCLEATYFAYLADLGVNVASTDKFPAIIFHETTKNWLIIIETAPFSTPIDGKRRKELKDLFAGCKAGLVFVTAFESRRTMQSFVTHIAWESEIWIAEDPDHMIHFNGSRFLGPYPDVMPKF